MDSDCCFCQTQYIKHEFGKSQNNAPANDAECGMLLKSGSVMITLNTALYLYIKYYGDLFYITRNEFVWIWRILSAVVAPLMLLLHWQSQLTNS